MQKLGAIFQPNLAQSRKEGPPKQHHNIMLIQNKTLRVDASTKI